MTKAEEAAKRAYPVEMHIVAGPLPGCEPFETDTNCVYRKAFQQGYEQAEKDIGWISVKERLPGPSEWVVACVEVSGICTCLTLATYNEETKEWHTDNWEDGEPEVYNPDYWMPIPTRIRENKE